MPARRAKIMTASSGKNSPKEWLPQGFVRLVGPHFGRRNRFEGKFAVVDGVLSYGFRRVEFKGFILDKTNT